MASNLDASPDRVRGALVVFAATTAIGSDSLHLRRFANLPDNAMAQLGALFKQSVATLTVLVHELLNILGRLGKKAGGSRTIAIMASFYRALMKMLCPTMREWPKEECHKHWDFAPAGSSSLRFAVLRAIGKLGVLPWRISSGTLQSFRILLSYPSKQQI